jgi:hypothetical protein
MRERHDILVLLRSATEGDVEAVIAHSDLSGEIEHVSSEDLLSFFNCMLDALLD